VIRYIVLVWSVLLRMIEQRNWDYAAHIIVA
jgi:hypothetical protein